MKKVLKIIGVVILYLLVCTGVVYLLHLFGLHILFLIMVFGIGAMLVWVLFFLKKTDRLTFTHIIVLWLVVNSTGWMWATYYLAYVGATNIAETLGRYVVTEILGVVVSTCTKSLVENLSSNNTWPDKTSSSDEPRDL